MYYTLIMRNVSSFVSLIACFCLLGFQMSGLHTHVDEHGYDGTPKGIHLHDFSDHVDTVEHLDNGILDGQNHLDDHDYTADKDVFIFDLALGASKVLDFSILAGFSLFVATKSIHKYSLIYLPSYSERRREHRWPQLRAPPTFSRLLSH
jgi:hypothetical protein